MQTLQWGDCIFKLSGNTCKLFIPGVLLPEHWNQYTILFVDMLHLPKATFKYVSIGRWENPVKEKEIDTFSYQKTVCSPQCFSLAYILAVLKFLGLAWKLLFTPTSFLSAVGNLLLTAWDAFLTLWGRFELLTLPHDSFFNVMFAIIYLYIKGNVSI